MLYLLEIYFNNCLMFTFELHMFDSLILIATTIDIYIIIMCILFI